MGWEAAPGRQTGPTALILSRQNLTQMARTTEQLKAISRGGQILKDGDGTADIILIATGPEVKITIKNLAHQASLAKRVWTRAARKNRSVHQVREDVEHGPGSN